MELSAERSATRVWLRRIGPLVACIGSITWMTIGRCASLRTPSLEDAIGMVRIQEGTAVDGSVGAFSPDGGSFAAVVWRGDLAKNTNVHTLVLIDLRADASGRHVTRELLAWDFKGDPADKTALPISQLRFLRDGRKIVFLGRKDDRPAQVFSVDVATTQVRQLTNHPTAVRSYAVSEQGSLLAFAALADADEEIARRSRLEDDGVLLSDQSLFSLRYPRAAMVLDANPRWARQYFRVNDGQSRLIYDSRQSRPRVPEPAEWEIERKFSVRLHDEHTLHRIVPSSLTSDATGSLALMYPYALAEQPLPAEQYDACCEKPWLAAAYGLIDLETGHMERLLDAPRSRCANDGPPLWAPGGQQVFLCTLLPMAWDQARSSAKAGWMSVDIKSRQAVPLPIAAAWKVAGWHDAGNGLLLTRDSKDGAIDVATLERGADGKWEKLIELGGASDFNRHWQPATNGRSVVAVRDGFDTPPELVAFDLATRRAAVLTALNPALHQRRYGAVEVFRWQHQYDSEASGLLIKPPDFEPGRRYPLVVLLDDGTLRGVREPYLLDAVVQSSGHAIQMLAADGFVVLYTRELHDWGGDSEGERMREHLESAIARLEREGLIDPQRVGLSGWSRAAWHVMETLSRGSRPVAAASLMDGGAIQYKPRLRPFSDEEIKRIHTPLLFEPHGPASLVAMASLADRLESFGVPTEVLYFATASHTITRPRHRLRSLQTHLDWWRFWLKDAMPAASPETAHFAQWQRMRRDRAALQDRQISRAQ